MSFVTELKRRNVVKMAILYAVVSWLILQVADVLFDALELPPNWVRLVLAVLILGFPLTLIFSWIYEMTPEGLKRENEIQRGQSITHITSKRLDYIIIGMLALAIGLFVLQYLRPPTVEAPIPATEAAAVPAQPDAVQTETPATPPTVQAILPDDKSIAVLPFVNMSSDKEQEYFSDGMAEELLNLLAKAPDLKVIARTSSFAFKGQNIEISEIAKELNVAHILEGSVRRAGNTVRIAAQLIRTADSTHLWSETYDRPLDDIFKVQDEIANAIAQALQIRMMGGTLSRRDGGTQNLEAYQLYLRARSANFQNTKASLEEAGAYLEQAIKVDPNYGLALSTLAAIFANKADNGFVDVTIGYESSRQMANQALQLSPESAYAHARLGYVYMNFDWDWAAADAEVRRARAISATDPEVLNQAGMLSYVRGQWDDAESQFQEALVRDPLNSYTLWNLGFTYYAAGRFAESEAVYRKLLEIEPDFAWTRNSLGKTLLAQGNTDDALAVVLQAVDEAERLKYIPVFLQATGRQAEADAALHAQFAQWADTGAYYISITYAYRGDHEQAIEWLERAYEQKDTFLSTIIGEPLFKNIADDPRFRAFLHKMNLPVEPVPMNWQ